MILVLRHILSEIGMKEKGKEYTTYVVERGLLIAIGHTGTIVLHCKFFTSRKYMDSTDKLIIAM